MKKTSLKAVGQEDAFEAIGKEWMLITGGAPESFNMMTASWGGFGWLWNKPVAFIFVRPERYTYGFLEAHDYLTLSFYDKQVPQLRKALDFCGVVSGKDHDKAKETGLVPLTTENGAVTFEQARLTLECRKLFRSEMQKEEFLSQECLNKWYGDRPGGSLHTMYVVEIQNVYVPD